MPRKSRNGPKPKRCAPCIDEVKREATRAWRKKRKRHVNAYNRSYRKRSCKQRTDEDRTKQREITRQYRLRRQKNIKLDYRPFWCLIEEAIHPSRLSVVRHEKQTQAIIDIGLWRKLSKSKEKTTGKPPRAWERFKVRCVACGLAGADHNRDSGVIYLDFGSANSKVRRYLKG